MANVSEEGSKDPLVDNEGHNLGRGVAFRVPFLATNADHIGRETLEGLWAIRGQLNFPDTSRWIGPVVPTTPFNFVVATAEIR